MALKMEKGSIIIKTVLYMKVILLMINTKEMGSLFMKMENITSVSGLTGKDMEKEHYTIKMGQ
jgi:hypothetical protein